MPLRLDGSKVHTHMIAAGLTPTTLAEISKISPSTIDRVLHNRAKHYSDFTVHSIARAVNCQPVDLYTDEALDTAITAAAAVVVESVVVERVAEAVTVVADALAPDAPAQTVAHAVPDMAVPMPAPLDLSAYFAYMQEQHKQALDQLTASHADALAAARRDAKTWRTVTLSLLGTLCALTILILLTHL